MTLSRECAMPNVAEVIRDHVTLAVECVDRLYLNAYVPGLQRGLGVVAFLRQRGQVIASPTLFGEITNAFKTALQRFCSVRGVPRIEFTKGQDKDKLVETYRRQFAADEGVVLVGVAQERAKAWAATKNVEGRRVHFTFNWRTVYVNHYYVYLIDREWGPAFIKVCGYAPYAVNVCLNAHEWAKRQAQRQGIPCEALDNGFLDCADPAALQAICDSLSADDIQDFFDRWVGSLPLPLSADDAASGFSYRLSILQMEVSLTQVFDNPVRGREFFEEVIRDNLDLGRPDRVQLLLHRNPQLMPIRASMARWTTNPITRHLLGTYCAPGPLRLCGHTVLGVHGSHAITLPEARRQGTLTAVAGAAQAAWADAGFRLPGRHALGPLGLAPRPGRLGQR